VWRIGGWSVSRDEGVRRRWGGARGARGGEGGGGRVEGRSRECREEGVGREERVGVEEKVGVEEGGVEGGK